MAVFPGSAFVMWDMIPAEWLRSPEREREWLASVAHLAPGDPGVPLIRLVCVELPDCALSWAYQDAYLAAAALRSDLVPPMISSREQWDDRKEQMVDVIWRLLNSCPPMVAVCAVAARRPKPPGGGASAQSDFLPDP